MRRSGLEGAARQAWDNALGSPLPIRLAAGVVSAQKADGICHKMAIRTAYKSYVQAPLHDGPAPAARASCAA